MRASPLRGLETVDEVFLSTSRAEEGLTRLEGPPVLGVAHRSLRTKERVQSTGLGGSRIQGVAGESFGGAEDQRATAGGRGATRSCCERSCEGKKASKQVKLAERSDSAVLSSGRPGNGLRSAERKSIVVRGSRQPRESVDVGETGGER